MGIVMKMRQLLLVLSFFAVTSTANIFAAERRGTEDTSIEDQLGFLSPEDVPLLANLNLEVLYSGDPAIFFALRRVMDQYFCRDNPLSFEEIEGLLVTLQDPIFRPFLGQEPFRVVSLVRLLSYLSKRIESPGDLYLAPRPAAQINIQPAIAEYLFDRGHRYNPNIVKTLERV